MRWPKATIVNMLTVTTGSLIGLWFRQYFSAEVQEMVFQAVGLGTIVVGIKMSLRIPDGYLLIFMFSLILGAVTGQLTGLDSLEEGLHDKRELLYVKSALDGFSSIALASTYGIGVLFSILPMFFFQGGITLLAPGLRNIFSEKVLNSLSATGGVLIIGISLNLLKVAQINLENMLPSLLVICILSYFYEKYRSSKDAVLET